MAKDTEMLNKIIEILEMLALSSDKTHLVLRDALIAGQSERINPLENISRLLGGFESNFEDGYLCRISASLTDIAHNLDRIADSMESR